MTIVTLITGIAGALASNFKDWREWSIARSMQLHIARPGGLAWDITTDQEKYEFGIKHFPQRVAINATGVRTIFFEPEELPLRPKPLLAEEKADKDKVAVHNILMAEFTKCSDDMTIFRS